ncbi:MAG: YjbQ family protein [Clostridiaceae bacterium]|nr:YjbQ family protein [Clostridiaceae bacterium]
MSKVYEYNLRTKKEGEFLDITYLVEQALKESNLKEGIVVVFCPHTTAGITINENADPDVVRDMLATFDKAYPKQGDYNHSEGNSHAHIKASLMGSSATIIVEAGGLKLGIWQGIYFTEFDGPRNRKVYIKFI